MNLTFWNKKRILMTGHTGFKGSWMSLWLQQLQAEVVGYALEPPTNPSLFGLADTEKRMTSIIGDIRDFNKISRIIEDYSPEIIIHMAAQPLVRKSYENPVETYMTNVLGTVNILEAIRKSSSVKAFLNITTDKCYENKEWFWGYRENEPLGGYDPYSSSKACSELVTSSYRRSYFLSNKHGKLNTAIATARAGNVIGGGDWAKDRLIPDCVRSWIKKEKVIIRYPNAIRPWQHVLEPLCGYLELIEKLYTDGNNFAEAWNFGPDENDAKSVGFVVKQLSNHWGKDADVLIDKSENPHEANYLKLDCSKAKNKLGWSPKWDLKGALNKTVEWYLTYQSKPEKLHDKTIEQICEYMETKQIT